MEKEILNAHEAAEMLGMHVVTIREKARKGLIPGRMEGHWRFTRRALLAWVEQGNQFKGEANGNFQPQL